MASIARSRKANRPSSPATPRLTSRVSGEGKAPLKLYAPDRGQCWSRLLKRQQLQRDRSHRRQAGAEGLFGVGIVAG